MATSDQAFVRALAGWGSGEATRLLGLFSDDWAKRLIDARAALDDSDPIEWLRTARSVQAGPDQNRVHPSWFVRALQDESQAVRRIVIGSVEEPLRSILVRELHIDPADLEPDRPADSEVRRVALSIWTEQLVGDMPPSPDDSEAIAALTILAPASVYRLARLCGLAKLAAISESRTDRSRRLGDERTADFRRGLDGPTDPRLLQLGAKDWAACRPRVARLGLLTIGRTLVRTEAHRLRWALQHVPYSVAKRIRAAANSSQAAIKAVSIWEGRILQVANARLLSEGRSTTRGSNLL